MAGRFWVPFMQHMHDSNSDSEGVRLWREILQALQDAMKRMAPSLSGEDCTYEQWKHAANEGAYHFFVSWLDDKGERCLSRICGASLTDCTSDRLLDRFDEALFALQMAAEVDDAEVLAADVADVLVDLTDAIERYGQHDGDVVYDEDIEFVSAESSFECMDQSESSPSGCEGFFVSIAA